MMVGVSAAFLNNKALRMEARHGNGRRKRTDINLGCHLFYVKTTQGMCMCVCLYGCATMYVYMCICVTMYVYMCACVRVRAVVTRDQ